MKINDPKIISLRSKVRAAQEEFSLAMAFHEVWKPTAYDLSLHERLGKSHSSGAFLIIRQSLRREMLMALTRIWDRDTSAVGMSAIANSLEDKRVDDALAGECESHWATAHEDAIKDVPAPERDAIAKASRLSEAKFGRDQSDALRQRAKDAIAIIRTYEDGGTKHDTLTKLKRLRDQRLAHRDTREVVSVGFEATDVEIEQFYQDMSKLIRLLVGAANDTDYQPEASAEITRRNAALFWEGVRGERTVGHPAYKTDNRRQSNKD